MWITPIFNNFFNRATCLSKLPIFSNKLFPKLKKVVLFFLVNVRLYKKNMVLFYIMLSLFLGGYSTSKTMCKHKGLVNQTLCFVLCPKTIYLFLLAFTQVYLPLLGKLGNTIKHCFYYNYTRRRQELCFYRASYFFFPIIPEMAVFCENFEIIPEYINSYKFQIDFFIKNYYFIACSGEFLIRIYNLPFKFKLKFSYTGAIV